MDILVNSRKENVFVKGVTFAGSQSWFLPKDTFVTMTLWIDSID